ncbi:MFS transporter [Halorubrum laminariae]|uniref:MFS transporter n=1 Tax=Halorubrum laminariae TaxID=1433523 RepID=A0ABD6C7H6_9EURY|nr:MFS transporter [Halorubrum laminariae]
MQRFTNGRLANYDVLVLVSLIWFLGKFVRYVFPPLFEPLQLTYGISNATIGSAFTGFMIVYALMQFPSGVVADWIGSVRIVAGGATVAGVGALALVVDSPFQVFVAAMLVIGAGTGVHKTVAVRLIARSFPDQTGRALGIHDTLGTFGGVAAPTAVVVLLSAPPILAGGLDALPGADWRAVFLIAGLSALALAGVFTVRFRGGRLDERRERNAATGMNPSVGTYLGLLRDVRFSAFICVSIGVAFANNGLLSFLPLYLSQVSGLSTATASLLYSLFFWMAFVQFVAGDLSDRIGRFPLLVSTAGIASVALWGIVLAPDAGLIALSVLIAHFGIGAHGFNPVRGAYLMELLPDRLTGGGLGVFRTLLMGVTALAPSVVGIVVDAFSFRVAFGLLATVLAVATVGAVGLWITD